VMADALFSIGEKTAAWRQVSTAIEKQPMAPSGWEAAANFYQRHGDAATAVGYWHEAMILDQTNPRWRIRKAQSLLDAKQLVESKALLQSVLKQRWHERFAFEVEDARYLLRDVDYAIRQQPR
jgi:predicted Zn-dependent protease